MVIKWEVIGLPSPQHPNRYKVNIKCGGDDLKKIIGFYGKKCGNPWKAKNREYDFSFYIYNVTDKDVENFNNKIKEFQNGGSSNTKSPANADSSFSRAAESPPVPAAKPPAKKTSGVVDFDVFDPNKINAVEIKKSSVPT